MTIELIILFPANAQEQILINLGEALFNAIES